MAPPSRGRLQMAVKVTSLLHQKSCSSLRNIAERTTRIYFLFVEHASYQSLAETSDYPYGSPRPRFSVSIPWVDVSTRENIYHESEPHFLHHAMLLRSGVVAVRCPGSRYFCGYYRGGARGRSCDLAAVRWGLTSLCCPGCCWSASIIKESRFHVSSAGYPKEYS